MIEREVPGAGNMNAEKSWDLSQTSCNVLTDMGPQIQWVQSHLTDDRTYCTRIAPDDETAIRQHA